MFDDLVALAARVMGTPTAVVNLIADERQWAKASLNLGHPQEIPREQSFCAHTILNPTAPMIICDARDDPRFADNPLVAEGLLFYAGVPLVTDDGHALGSLCVADSQPRTPSEVDIAALITLAAAASAQLDLRRRAAEASRLANQFAAILTQAPDAFVSILPDSTITEWNPQAEALFGWTREEALGRDFCELAVAEHYRAAYRARIAPVAAEEEPRIVPYAVEIPAVHRDGTPLELEISIATFVDADGCKYFNAFGREVSARKAEERAREADLEALRSLANLQRRLARNSDEAGLWQELCASATTQANADAAVLWIAEPDGAVVAIAAHNRAHLVGARMPSGAASVVRNTLASGELTFIADIAGDGRANPELMRNEPSVSGALIPVTVGDTPAGVLCVLYEARREELTPRETGLLTLLCGEAAVAIERAAMMGRLRHLADHDELTDAVNRRVLVHDRERELDRARRKGEPVTVAMLDLDYFKAFNDGHGHQAGDRLLREAVAAWTAVLRPTDTLARYGGEEFALVLPDCTAENARALADRLRAVVPLGQTVSIGLAQWNGEETGEQLTRRADDALYTAKRGGRDRAFVAAG